VYCTMTAAEETSFRSEDIHVVEHHDPQVPLDGVVLKLHHATHRVMNDRYSVTREQAVRVSTFSEVPAGSGLGTSSTIVVALVEAYRSFFSLPLSEYDIADLAIYVERTFLGQAGGLQDQYASTFGGINFIEFGTDRVVVNPLRIRPEFASELEANIVMFFTGVSRESSKIILEQSASVNDARRLEAMHRVKEEAFAMKDALLRGNITGMAEVLQRGWEAKKATSSFISNSTMDGIYAAAMENGAMAGKVSGAGGGGFMFFMVPPESRAAVSQRLSGMGLTQYLVRFTERGVQSWSA
jgi:D-glycero-alpha-D-manno-heptose-7-phosphate kinase